jgi:hypothetical protein
MARTAHWMRCAWAAPNTVLGLLAAGTVLALGGRARWVDGVLEVHGRGRMASALRRHCPFDAITLGHVVLATDARAQWRWRQHERVHVGQCERWGPLFGPAYLAAGAWAWLRGGNAYGDNAFERAAFAPPAVTCRRPDRRPRSRGGPPPAPGGDNGPPGLV